MNDYMTINMEWACELGVTEAVVLNCITQWIKYNEAEGNNHHDGRTWMYASVAKIQTNYLPCYSQKQIRSALNTLEEDGVILSGNYNKMWSDRTKWYAINENHALFTDLPSRSHGKNDDHDLPSRENANCPTGQLSTAPQGEPLPITKEITKKDIEKENIQKKKKSTRFIPPTIEDIRAYAREKQIDLDAESFFYFYESKGWMVGKNKMKSWHKAASGWAARNKANTPSLNERLELGANVI